MAANDMQRYIVFFMIANLRTQLANMLIIDQMSLKPKACSRDFQRLCTAPEDNSSTMGIIPVWHARQISRYQFFKT